jgi:hypothetical protein
LTLKTDPARAAQDEQILRLRIAGLPLRAIGERVGLSHQGVADRITAAISELVTPAAEEYRALEALRLDDLVRVAYGVLASADTGDLKLKAIDRLTKLSESRRKLWALDMPERLDVALSRRNSLEGDLVADALGAALEALEVSGLDGKRQQELREYAGQLAQWQLLGGQGPRPEPPPAVPGPVQTGNLEAQFRALMEADGVDADALLAEVDAEDDGGE